MVIDTGYRTLIVLAGIAFVATGAIKDRYLPAISDRLVWAGTVVAFSSVVVAELGLVPLPRTGNISQDIIIFISSLSGQVGYVHKATALTSFDLPHCYSGVLFVAGLASSRIDHGGRTKRSCGLTVARTEINN